MLELVGIAKTPPICGKTILYQHLNIYDEQKKPTNILFNSADIEFHFKDKDLPLFNPEENHAIIAWIKNRDEGHKETTPIPDQINFKNMAIGLINNGYGEIECTDCNRYYPASLIIQQRPDLHAGWNTESYRCPKGHELIQHDWIHVTMKRKNLTND